MENERVNNKFQSNNKLRRTSLLKIPKISCVLTKCISDNGHCPT
jgi:hypothetical protein